MRKELENTNWHVYGLSTADFGVTLRLIDSIISCRAGELKQELSGVIVTDEKGNEVPKDHAGFQEVIADLNYYHWIENLFIYQFGFWRLHGILEGILRQKFFPEEELPGLKRKIDRIIQLGFKVDKKEHEELLRWSRLRNALSHFPPEEYRPTVIMRDDLEEYIDLACRVLHQLTSQKESNSNQSQ